MSKNGSYTQYWLCQEQTRRSMENMYVFELSEDEPVKTWLMISMTTKNA